MREEQTGARQGPTVGRIVHYRTGGRDELAHVPGEDCLAAIVVHAWGAGSLNLLVLDMYGEAAPRSMIPDAEHALPGQPSWHWPERAA